MCAHNCPLFRQLSSISTRNFFLILDIFNPQHFVVSTFYCQPFVLDPVTLDQMCKSVGYLTALSTMVQLEGIWERMASLVMNRASYSTVLTISC